MTDKQILWVGQSMDRESPGRTRIENSLGIDSFFVDSVNDALIELKSSGENQYLGVYIGDSVVRTGNIEVPKYFEEEFRQHDGGFKIAMKAIDRGLKIVIDDTYGFEKLNRVFEGLGARVIHVGELVGNYSIVDVFREEFLEN